MAAAEVVRKDDVRAAMSAAEVKHRLLVENIVKGAQESECGDAVAGVVVWSQHKRKFSPVHVALHCADLCANRSVSQVSHGLYRGDDTAVMATSSRTTHSIRRRIDGVEIDAMLQHEGDVNRDLYTGADTLIAHHVDGDIRSGRWEVLPEPAAARTDVNDRSTLLERAKPPH